MSIYRYEWIHRMTISPVLDITKSPILLCVSVCSLQ